MPARLGAEPPPAVLEADLQGDVDHLGEQQRQERVRRRAAEQLDHPGVGQRAQTGEPPERQRVSRACDAAVAVAYS